MDRREFLKTAFWLTLGTQLPISAQALAGKRVGIALGSGGANGLAHIVMLEVLDDMGIRPSRISGASIGALVGALYASGRTGREIRDLVNRLVASGNGEPDAGLISESLFLWLDLIDPDIGHGGLIDGERILSYLYREIETDTFEDLEIPLEVVAADFWEQEPVVFQSGPLLPALKASMALPGVFTPVVHEGLTLVDGGTVNPLPYDLLMEECDIVIAVNVLGLRPSGGAAIPGYFETIFNSVKILQQSIVREKMRRQPPDIYIEPSVCDVRALEFYRADEIFEQAAPAAKILRHRLLRLLSR